MNIIVTGSIAFDYLMSFPGKFTEHFLPEHMYRVSLSFLVDTMDKRRGGCAPNIAYTLALLGERPRLMATAGQDFDDYRRWLEAAGVDTSLVREVDGKFTASFFCSTDADSNQIASFYTGAMANAGELSFRTVADCGLAIISPNDPGGDAPVRGRVPDARHSVHLGSGPAVRADVGRRAPRRHGRRGDCHLQRLRIRADPAEDRSGRGRHPGAYSGPRRHARRARLLDPRAAAATDVPAVPPHRIVDPTGVGDAFRGGFLKGLAARRELSHLRAAWQRGRDLRAGAPGRAKPRAIRGPSSWNATNSISATRQACKGRSSLAARFRFVPSV